MKTNLIVGIDVSKDTMDFAEKSGLQTLSTFIEEGDFSNKKKSINKFLSQYDPKSVRIVFEPTGTYSDKLQQALTAEGFVYHTVNPRQSHHYALSRGVTNKTDAQAARMLAEMGQVLDLPIHRPSSKSNQKRKQLIKAVADLQDDQRRYKNKLHALKQLAEANELLETMCKDLIFNLESQIVILEKELKQIKDVEFEKKKELATSVCGIGDLSATWILTFTNGFESFDTNKKVLKFLGVAPGSHRSGSSVNKKMGINKSCTGKVRGLLFMAAKSAIRFNPACKDLYERLRSKGKNYYQAIVAVMAKLIKQVYAVVTKEVKYEKDYHLKFQK